jgi:glycogen debranching enzyme
LDVYRNKDDFDSAIRPNQLFALGLEHTCISKEAAEKILETVKKHLVTPFGLRTLSPSDPEYKREYSGNQEKRDAAYHQGTVWPWLTGIFCDALFKTYGSRKDVKDYIDSTFRRLWKEHLFENGIFHISEIFEPEEPYKACGCIAQAWSTAEILRVLKMLK